MLLKLKPYKIPVVHALHHPDPNKRLRFCSWVLEKVNSGEVDAKDIFLVTRRGFIYMDRYVYKITGIRPTVTEKQSECLRTAAVRSPVRRRVGQPRPRATAVCSRAFYLDEFSLLFTLNINKYFASWLFTGESDSVVQLPFVLSMVHF